MLGSPGHLPFDVDQFNHGMTVATNALLENRSARTVFVTNHGFTDLIEIGRQDRASLYRLGNPIHHHWSPEGRRVAIGGRNGPDGELEPLDGHRGRSGGGARRPS